MSKFDIEEDAVGSFWRSERPEAVWSGRLRLDEFPTLSVFTSQRGTFHGDSQIYGITTKAEHVSLFGSQVSQGITTSGSTRMSVADVRASFLILGHRHFTAQDPIRRLVFFSQVAERSFNLHSSPFLEEVRYRKAAGRNGKPLPVLHKQVASYFDRAYGLRFRVYKPSIPTTDADAHSQFVIDFLNGETIENTLAILIRLRDLLSVLCHRPIDFQELYIQPNDQRSRGSARLYLGGSIRKHEWEPHANTIPTIRFTDREHFGRVLHNWLKESSASRIARAVFASILLDGQTVRWSHLRELMTVIEMIGLDKTGRPMPQTLFNTLLVRLNKALADFEADSAARGEIVGETDVVTARMGSLNDHNARTKLQRILESVPRRLVEVPENFAKRTVKLRNSITHDMGQIRDDDPAWLIFCVLKLKAVYSAYDILSLGAPEKRILDHAAAFQAARFVYPPAGTTSTSLPGRDSA